LGAIYKIAFANAMKKKIVAIKDDKVSRTVEELTDNDREKLTTISNGVYDKFSKDEITALKARKLIEEKPFKWYVVTKGPEYKELRVKEEP
jgi:hypothetical protein